MSEGLSRPEIIRMLEEDSRFSNNVFSWQSGYMSFETLMLIVVKTLLIEGLAVEPELEQALEVDNANV